MSSDDLKTSTPLQCRYDSGYGSYSKDYNPMYDKIIELSPIRKQPLKSKLLKVCSILNTGAVKKFNEALDKVSKKLIFSSDDKDSDSVDNCTDSGIASIDVSNENESICRKLEVFPTDENCNILFNLNETDRIYQPYKYICADIQKELTQSFKKELKSSTPNGNIYSFKLSVNDVSNDVIVNNTEETNLKFDLLHELNIRNCTSIISCILSYLSEEELRIAGYVCKRWQDIVFSDKNANDRRKNYINYKKNIASGPNKENRFRTASPTQRHHKTAFISVINVETETSQPLVFDDFSGRFDSFIKEAEVIEEKELLQKCPQCFYPSKILSDNTFCCTRKFCQYEFCKKCSGPYLNNHSCSVSELNESLPKIIIGSKKSKKNLRRL